MDKEQKILEIKALNPQVKGMKLIVPFDGMIEIDANGIAHVSERAAEALVRGTNDWKYVTEENSNTKSNDDVSNADKSEDEQVFAGIKKMKLEDMISMAQEAGYPEKEWERFSKKEKMMAAYLIKKYNEAKLENDSENV